MKKDEFVAQVAKNAKITKKMAADVVNVVFETVTEALKDGEKITFTNFGTFEVAERKEREGINPATGKKMTIPATKVPKFRAGKGLKDAIK